MSSEKWELQIPRIESVPHIHRTLFFQQDAPKELIRNPGIHESRKTFSYVPSLRGWRNAP